MQNKILVGHLPKCDTKRIKEKKENYKNQWLKFVDMLRYMNTYCVLNEKLKTIWTKDSES